MSKGEFNFEDCLLKHFVRHEAWLPTCKRRLASMGEGLASTKRRRLKYLTFCAIGAVDVLMLDVANIVKRSASGKFDTVYFFNMDAEAVAETRKRIPGARGFAGDFIDIVLYENHNRFAASGEISYLEPLADESVSDETASLEPPTEQLDTTATRTSQQCAAMQQSFVDSFPFDVINLDLEKFFFKPSDPVPGKLMSALRKIFEWQKLPIYPGKKADCIDGFSLMFTTQVGPPNMSSEYLEMLRVYVQSNIEADAALQETMLSRTGHNVASSLLEHDFDTFFKLAVPKAIAAVLKERDWYIDPAYGISIYEFERPSKDGPYIILHIVMEVKRQHPALERRPPGMDLPEVNQAYRQVARLLFSTSPTVVDEIAVEPIKKKLELSLEYIKARRRKYYPEQ
jgi:hypothetical protein